MNSNRHIISVSRRTDIPEFYMEWFIRRLKDGFAYYKNPFTGKLIHVSLQPEHVAGFVFWSKNFAPMLPYLKQIEQYSKNFFFHFTITGLSKEIELYTPPHDDAIKDLIYLSKRYSPDHVIWRFDPVCITNHISFEQHKETFTYCAEKLKGYVTSCYISFVHPYAKVLRNFKKYTSHYLLDISPEEKKQYAEQLVHIAQQYGMQIYACCNDYLLSNQVQKASCINSNKLLPLWGYDNAAQELPAPTRKECACTRSQDIGAYDTCPHGCMYCYANSNKEACQTFIKKHNPEWQLLNGRQWTVDSEQCRGRPMRLPCEAILSYCHYEHSARNA